MQDGAIVHLTEDGTQKLEVPDDHMMMCMHTPTFQRRWMCFCATENFGISGAFFFIGARQQHHLLCTEQCPEVVSKVSIPLNTFLYCYSKFFQEHMLKKTKMAYLFAFWPYFFFI